MGAGEASGDAGTWAQLLGPFAVRLPDGRTAGPWERPAARRLVQLLLLRPAYSMGREEAADILFPGLEPDRAPRALSKALSMARAAMAPFEVLHADRQVIWLARHVQTDWRVVTDGLRTALAMAASKDRDEALTKALHNNGRLLDGELYADWAIGHRDDLEMLRSEARTALARDRLAGHGRRSATDVLEAWRAAHSGEPSNEDACGVLLELYARAGQRDLAVRVFHRTLAALDDLGLEPSSRLDDRYQRALASIPHEGRITATVPSAPVVSFGRATTLAALTTKLRRSGSVLTVLAAAGIGKTHVLDLLSAEMAASGWAVARAASVPGDDRTAMNALRLALHQIGLDGAGPAVRRLVDPHDDDGDVAASDRARLIAELASHFDRHALRQPLLIVLDDVHWADAGLHDVLAGLGSLGRPHRWSALLAARRDELPTHMEALLATTATVELGPLEDEAVAALVTHHMPGLPTAAVSAVVGRSGGNPFFAVELARLTPGVAVPSRIVDLLRARLARCSSDARRLAPLLALLDDDCSVEAVLRLASGPPVAMPAHLTIRVIDELVGAGLVAERAAGVSMAHPLLRDAALALLNPVRQAALHRLLASGLVDDAAARHWLAAFECGGLEADARAAAAAAFAAGHQARDRFADEAALRLLTDGLRAFESTRPAVRRSLRPDAVRAWLAVGEIQQDREDRPAAEAAYRSGLGLSETDDERARLWSALGSLAYRAGDFAGAAVIYEQGIAAISGEATVVRSQLRADLAWLHFRHKDFEPAIALLEEACAALQTAGDAMALGRTLDRLAITLGEAGRPAEGLLRSEQAFAVLGELEDERELAVLRIHRARLFGRLRRFGEGLAECRAARRVFVEAGDRYMQAVVHWLTADIHDLRGDFVAALQERDAEVRVLDQVGNQRQLAGAQAHRARLLTALGKVDDAAYAARQAVAAARLTGDPEFVEAIEAQRPTG
jgi:DNA-binding SARP family transcriptional activator/tetratricopeptide (TPR) repeat protein